jgi:5-(carboxyamino)imidazole ribonucleotide mutase
MGSTSDWETMQHAAQTLEKLGVSHECRVVSAHRTPDWMRDYAQSAESRGLKILIAGAGGAAHLPGMTASFTLLPVLGVPVQSHALQGLDSLLSIVQMPGGVPVGTMAIGKAGAINAALLAVRMLAGNDPSLRNRLQQFADDQTRTVLEAQLP